MILDGRALHGKSLAEYAGWREFLALGIQRGWKAPPLSQVSDADPLTAWMQQGFWMVTCPDCADLPELELQPVWLDTLLTWCTVCGNAGGGSRWRRVVLPEQSDEIIALLAVRPMAARTWKEGEPLRNLLAENVSYGLTVPTDEASP